MLAVQPVSLERAGVRLEPLARAHAAGLAAAGADGDLWRLRVTWVPAPDEGEAYVGKALADRAAGHRMPFVVVDAASGAVLGSTSYHDIVPAIGRLEIGHTWYTRRVQRSHVNTACKLMLMSHAFDTLGARLVGWRTDALNTASRAAIERLGARCDGVLRHHHPRRDGSVRDTVMYSMTAAEWPAARERLERRLAAGG